MYITAYAQITYKDLEHPQMSVSAGDGGCPGTSHP